MISLITIYSSARSSGHHQSVYLTFFLLQNILAFLTINHLQAESRI